MVYAFQTTKRLAIGEFHLCLLDSISKAEKRSFVYKTKTFPFEHDIQVNFLWLVVNDLRAFLS